MNQVSIKIVLASLILCGCTFKIQAQVAAQKIGNNPTVISPSAVLEVDSANKGVLLPKIALTSATDNTTIAAPASSLLIYNTATAGTAPNEVTPGFYYWDGTATRWSRINSPDGAIGNEVTDAVLNGGLTRTGTGTALDPYKLKINDGTVNEQVLTWDGTANKWIAAASTNWKLTGNTGTTAATNFIGTTDAVDFVTKTNNVERMRIDAAGNVGIMNTTPAARLDVVGSIAFRNSTNVSGPSVLYDGNSNFLFNFGLSAGNVQLNSTTDPASVNDRISFIGFGSTTYTNRARISAFSDGAWSSTSQPTRLLFNTTLIGATSSSTQYEIKNDGTSIWSVGGAERMRLTSTGLGIGTAAPTTKLQVQGSGINGVGFFQNTSNFTGGVNFDAPHLTVNSGDDTPGNVTRLALSVGSGSQVYLESIAKASSLSDFAISTRNGAGVSERMRIDQNGNVGIGTTTPTEKLEVAGAVKIVDGTQGAGKVLTSDATGKATWQAASTTTWGLTGNAGTTAATNFIGTTDAVDFVTKTNNVERMRIDAVGNVGIGVTPSVWTGSTVRVQLPNGGVFGTKGANANFLSNAYINSGWKYVTANPAALYSHESGIHNWYTAPSGAADSAITFTQAMTLTNGGNLGIGTTAPTTKLHIDNGTTAGAITIVDGTQGAGKVLTSDATGKATWQAASTTTWGLTGNTGTTAATNFIGTTDAVDFVTKTNNVERMRIDAAGNVGIMNTTPAARLDVVGSIAFRNSTNVSGPSVLYDGNSNFLFNFGLSAGNVQLNSTTDPASVNDRISFIGFGSTTYTNRARISAFSDGAWSSTSQPTRLLFNTTLIGATSSSTQYEIKNDGTSIWSVGGAERMRLTSTGLGIGTAAPTTKLQVQGSGINGVGFFQNTSNFTGGVNFDAPHLTVNSGDDTPGNVTRLALSVGSGSQVYLESIAKASSLSDFAISTRNGAGVSERMRIDQNGNVGIGTTTPVSKLDVNGVIAAQIGIDIKGDAGAAGTVSSGIIFRGYGISHANIAYMPNERMFSLQTGNSANDLGSFYGSVGLSMTGNLGIGTTTPTRKLEVVGSDALINGITVGTGAGNFSSNAAIGFQALNNNLGVQNTAIGNSALLSNTSGQFNTAVGFEALKFSTTTNSNTAIGNNAQRANTTGSANTAIGSSALLSNTIGFQNTVTGVSALGNNTSGSKNTAIGNETLAAATTGNDNTVLGFIAGSNITTGSNNIVIGSGALASSATVSNEVTIGKTGMTYRIFGTWSNASDQRYKNTIEPATLGLNLLTQLKPVTYFYKNSMAKNKSYGFIAQEVQQALKALGKTEQDGLVTIMEEKDQYLGLNYTEFVPILTKGIQEQQVQIQQLQSQLQQQQASINVLLKEMEMLKQKVK